MDDTPGEKLSWTRFLPVSRTLLGRICKDYCAITVLGAAVLIGFHWLFVTFLPLYDVKYKLTLVRRMHGFLKAMIGQDFMEIISTTGIGSFAYLHPISLAVLFGFAILLPTGTIVGQIDRGTIDLILSRPVSRRKFMATSIVAGLIVGAIMVGAMLLGSYIGSISVHDKLHQPYLYSRIVTCAVNLYVLYLVALGYSTLFSAITTIRSSAVGWAFSLSLGTYMLHFLAQWWEPIKKISFVGPLYYFRPIKIAAGNYDPTQDIFLLAAAALILLCLAVICFTRRDIVIV